MGKRTYLLLVKTCFLLPRFLPPGIFEISLAGFSKIKKFIPNRWFIAGINIKKRDHIGSRLDNNRIFIYCADKVIVFVNNNVITFFKNKHKVKLKNISDFISNIQYPKCEFVRVSSVHNYTITKYVCGDYFHDKKHLMYLAFELLHFAVNSQDVDRPTRYDCLDNEAFGNIKYSIQHGDIRWWNVIWTDEDSFSLIDFDAINIYPCLYDFFSIVILDMRTEGIKEFINGSFDSIIQDYIKAHNIFGSLSEFKDEVLAAFVLVSFTRKNTADIVKDNIPRGYRKTLKVLLDIE